MSKKKSVTLEDLLNYQRAHRAESRKRYVGLERAMRIQHEDVIAQIEARLPARLPAQAQEEQEKDQWKVGDIAKDRHRIGKIVEMNDKMASLDVGPHNIWRYKKELIRPSEAEITAYNLAQEEAKITELQNNDCCEEQPLEVMAECKAIGIEDMHVSCPERYVAGVAYYAGRHGGLSLYAVTSDMQTKFGKKIPRSEFLRRAHGTASRIKKEVEDKERNKPLVKGMKVHCMLNHFELLTIEPNAEGNYFMWRMTDTYGQLHAAKRDQFTIIEP